PDVVVLIDPTLAVQDAPADRRGVGIVQDEPEVQVALVERDADLRALGGRRAIDGLPLPEVRDRLDAGPDGVVEHAVDPRRLRGRHRPREPRRVRPSVLRRERRREQRREQRHERNAPAERSQARHATPGPPGPHAHPYLLTSARWHRPPRPRMLPPGSGYRAEAKDPGATIESDRGRGSAHAEWERVAAAGAE